MDLIDAANKNPFAGNTNNLKYIIVEDLVAIKKIAAYSEQPWITESSLVIIICSDETDLENIYGERGRVYSRQQAGAAIQTMLLKLVDLGLSGCWVGAYNDEQIRRLFKIPKHIQIEAIIPIGYNNEGKKSKTRKRSLEATIYWENWETNKKPKILFAEPINKYQLRK